MENQCNDNLCLRSALLAVLQFLSRTERQCLLSYGLVLVNTLDLGLLRVNGILFVHSVICAGIKLATRIFVVLVGIII